MWRAQPDGAGSALVPLSSLWVMMSATRTMAV